MSYGLYNAVIRRKLLSYSIFSAIVIATCATINFQFPSRFDRVEAIMALVAFFVALYPAVNFFMSPQAKKLPFIPLCSLFYILFFILPPFLSDYVFPPGTPARIYSEAPIVAGYGFEAILPILLGVSALVGGVAIGGKLRWIPKVHLPEIPDSRLPWIMRALLALHISFYIIPGLSRFPSLGQLMGPVGILGFGIAVLVSARKIIHRYEVFAIFCLLLPIRIIFGLATSSLNNALILIAVLIILVAALNRRLLLPVLGLVIVGMFAYAPMKAYRNYLWNLPSEMSVIERVKAVGGQLAANSFAAAVKAPMERQSSLDSILWPLLKRLDQATVLAIIVERTGHDVEPWGGQTLTRLATGIIPRFIWPEKPMETLGNEFGRRYGIIRPDELGMSVNLPWLTEFYANFLLPGVVFGMLLVGIMFRLLDRIFNHPDSQGVDVVFAATFLLPLAAQESNISLMISNLPLLAGALWCFLYLSAKFPWPGLPFRIFRDKDG